MTNQSPQMLETLAAKIKEVVDREDDASDSDSSIGEVQTNRFNKLKRKSRFVSRGRLNVGGSLQTDTTQTFYGSKKRATITSRRYSNTSSNDENAYQDIAIEEILAPINDPAELVAHPAHRITFRRQTLPLLASHALQTISTEHEHRVQLSRLLTAFLGDDPSLIMQTYEKEIAGTSLHATPKVAPNMESEDVDAPAKAVTRRTAAAEESSALAEEFTTPSYDRNLGIPPDEAEEARRLLQAALDRSEEYLRCMQRVRSGLVKADRYRKRTWRWAKDSAQSAKGDT